MKLSAAHNCEIMVNNSACCENILFLSSLVLVPIAQVKTHTTRGQFAEVHNSASQRVNAEYLEWLVGLTDGDGTFTIINNRGYILHKYSIGLDPRDIQLLYKIKSKIGVGKIEIGKEQVKYTVSNIDHLIHYILPIFDNYPCLSRKHFQYQVWRDTLIRRKSSEPLLVKPEYSKDIANSIKSVEDILELPYFDNWLIGFIEAEGSFSISFEENGKQIRPYFYIDQKFDYHLMEAIRTRLKFNSKVSSRKNSMFALTAKSKREIENVINFINKANIKLQGYKKLQFLLWIKEIRKLSKYSEIKLPVNY